MIRAIRKEFYILPYKSLGKDLTIAVEFVYLKCSSDYLVNYYEHLQKLLYMPKQRWNQICIIAEIRLHNFSENEGQSWIRVSTWMGVGVFFSRFQTSFGVA